MNPVFAMMALQAAPAAPAPNMILQLLPFILIFVIFYFLLIRPQQQARKRHAAMVDAVRRGDKVVTAGGLLGKVVRAGDGAEIEVELAEGVVVSVIKHTLTDVKSKNQPAEPEKK
jgi:preprotein translocase subunit YajC